MARVFPSIVDKLQCYARFWFHLYNLNDHSIKERSSVWGEHASVNLCLQIKYLFIESLYGFCAWRRSVDCKHRCRNAGSAMVMVKSAVRYTCNLLKNSPSNAYIVKRTFWHWVPLAVYNVKTYLKRMAFCSFNYQSAPKCGKLFVSSARVLPFSSRSFTFFQDYFDLSKLTNKIQPFYIYIFMFNIPVGN